MVQECFANIISEVTLIVDVSPLALMLYLDPTETWGHIYPVIQRGNGQGGSPKPYLTILAELDVRHIGILVNAIVNSRNKFCKMMVACGYDTSAIVLLEDKEIEEFAQWGNLIIDKGKRLGAHDIALHEAILAVATGDKGALAFFHSDCGQLLIDGWDEHGIQQSIVYSIASVLFYDVYVAMDVLVLNEFVKELLRISTTRCGVAGCIEPFGEVGDEIACHGAKFVNGISVSVKHTIDI